MAYEQLVLALGSITRTLPIPGLAEHGLGFKNLADAIHLRNHILRELETADAEPVASRSERHLTFVFVGAGYAGVEVLADRDALRYYPRLRAARQRWVLVDAAPTILPEIPTRLGEGEPVAVAGRKRHLRMCRDLPAFEEGPRQGILGSTRCRE